MIYVNNLNFIMIYFKNKPATKVYIKKFIAGIIIKIYKVL